MGKVDQRKHTRNKVALHAIVSDRQQQNAIRCMIRDASISGCNIISRKVSNLPDKVLINISSLNQLIKGRIVWRNQDSAGIEFEWEANRPDDRRNASRQEVNILATITDNSDNKLADCIICDASMIGCRISCKELSTLPNDFLIDIPGLTEPVQALIVWRKDNLAGLVYVWKSDFYILDDTLMV